MATIRDFHNKRQDGTVESAKSGTVYTIGTDANGVISCSCIGWLHDSKMRRGEKRAIKDRWCSHLDGLRDGTLGHAQHRRAGVAMRLSALSVCLALLLTGCMRQTHGLGISMAEIIRRALSDTLSIEGQE